MSTPYTVTASFNPPKVSAQAWAHLSRLARYREIVDVTVDLDDRPHFHIVGKKVPDTLVSGGDTDDILVYLLNNHPDAHAMSIDRNMIPECREQWHVVWWIQALRKAINISPINEVHYLEGHLVFDYRAPTVTGDADRIDIELGSLRARMVYDQETEDMFWYQTQQSSAPRDLAIASIKGHDSRRIKGVPGDFIITFTKALRCIRGLTGR